MSNAVDIVLIGGIRNGRMFCMELANAVNFYETLGNTKELPVVTYAIVKRQIAGVWYRFAIPNGSVEPTDAEVIAAGAIAQWDLNRVQVVP